MDHRLRKVSFQAWEHFPSYGTAYIYARIIDEAGSGCVDIDIATMADELARSPRTCKDHLRACKRSGLFRRIKWIDKDHVRVYYSAMAKVLAARGMVNSIAVDKVSIDNLKHKKVVIAMAAAQVKQDQSLHCCLEETPGTNKGRNPDVMQPAAIFGGRTSLKASGGTKSIRYRTKRFTLLKAGTPTYGASQAAIAKVLGRAERTVRRRLSAPYARQLAVRLNSDLKPVPKVQLAVDVGPSAIADLDRQANFGSTRLIKAFGRAWNPKCNVYLCDRELSGSKRLNKEVRRILLKAR